VVSPPGDGSCSRCPAFPAGEATAAPGRLPQVGLKTLPRDQLGLGVYGLKTGRGKGERQSKERGWISSLRFLGLGFLETINLFGWALALGVANIPSAHAFINLQ